MQSQFGLFHLWSQGDAVTRSVAVVLLVMSLLSWTVLLIKGLVVLRARGQARRAEAFWHSPDFASGLAQLGPDADNPFLALAEQGRESVAHHRQARNELHDSLDVSDWITRCLRNTIDDRTARLQSGLAVLASVGSTAPFVGLFGTVWGIYHALLSMGSAGESTLDKVAGPIGEALVMTALGLAVAIPAVLGYNALVRGNKAVIVKLNRFAHDLHAYLLTGARVGAAAGAQVVALKKS